MKIVVTKDVGSWQEAFNLLDINEGVKITKYATGENRIQLPARMRGEYDALYGGQLGGGDLLALLMTIRAIRARGAGIQLWMPTFPYARQDRAQEEAGLSNDCQAFYHLLSSSGASRVNTVDLHNESVSYSWRSWRSTPLSDMVLNAPLGWLRDDGYHMVVAPDLGAVKRCLSVAAITQSILLVAGKQRAVDNSEVTTGIIGTYSPHHTEEEIARLANPAGYPQFRILIVDDILDGGRTLRGVSDMLRHKYGQRAVIDALVTHHVNPRGTSIVTEGTVNTLHSVIHHTTYGVKFYTKIAR